MARLVSSRVLAAWLPSDDNLRPQQLQLFLQIRRTFLHFIRFWVAIARRAALEDIADEHIRTRQAHSGDDLVEQLSGPADERAALAVFVFAGGFADERDPGTGVALARHGMGPGLGQFALLALGDLCGDAGQAGFGVGPWLGIVGTKGRGRGLYLCGFGVGGRIFGCRRRLTPDGKISDEIAIDL
jgi:hypothetical protein